MHEHAPLLITAAVDEYFQQHDSAPEYWTAFGEEVVAEVYGQDPRDAFYEAFAALEGLYPEASLLLLKLERFASQWATEWSDTSFLLGQEMEKKGFARN